MNRTRHLNGDSLRPPETGLLPRPPAHEAGDDPAESGEAPLTSLRHTSRSQGDSLPGLREFRRDVLFRAECLYLHALIRLTGNNLVRACEMSGLSRSRLYTLLKKYQLGTPYQLLRR